VALAALSVRFKGPPNNVIRRQNRQRRNRVESDCVPEVLIAAPPIVETVVIVINNRLDVILSASGQSGWQCARRRKYHRRVNLQAVLRHIDNPGEAIK
jgi:hypothetical protein